MNKSRITIYSDSYRDELRERFFEKFREDKHPFAEKLKQASMPKGTYSSLLNNSHEISKHTLETMRAYLENRPPKYKTFNPATHAYCGCCEEICLKESMRGPYGPCLPCKNEITLKSKKKHWSVHEAYCRAYRRQFLIRGPFRDTYLKKRQALYLNSKYGKFGSTIALIIQIKKEVGELQDGSEQ